MRWTFDPLGSRGVANQSVLGRRVCGRSLTTHLGHSTACSIVSVAFGWLALLAVPPSLFCHPPRWSTSGVARPAWPVRGLVDANLRCFGDNVNNKELAVKETMGCTRETNSVPGHPNIDS